MKTHISWTHSTWNPSVGCTKVSPGCHNCYAEAIVKRGMFARINGHTNFNEVRLHPDRVNQVRKFGPVVDAAGRQVPRMVFVNSMSDLFHESIPMEFIDQVFGAMEAAPNTVFQVLTKRPGPMRRYLIARYADLGLPRHIWVGTSVEDNYVARRLDILRDIKTSIGGVAFVSAEPIIGDCSKLSFEGFDWILIGGESGMRCRPMKESWALQCLAEARRVGAAVWFKQWGHPRNNPLVQDRVANYGVSWTAAWKQVVASGAELQPEEKGGATVSGQAIHELPAVYHEMTAALRTF
jgi:protein gp37